MNMSLEEMIANDDCSQKCYTDGTGCSPKPKGCVAGCKDDWSADKCSKAKNNKYWDECKDGEAGNKCKKTCGKCAGECEPCPTKCSIVLDCRGKCRPPCWPDDPGYPWSCDWCWDETNPPCMPTTHPPGPAPPPPCAK